MTIMVPDNRTDRQVQMPPGESAGKWLRVSSLKQDEEQQEPDILGWGRERGYVWRREYKIHGKSASKGKHQEELDKMIEDMRLGIITVCVVWASDRIERRGVESAFSLARRVREAGGRIEYVNDTYLNDANDMSDLMLAMAAKRDEMEAKRKAQRAQMNRDNARTAGFFAGRPPYGYKSVGEKHKQNLVPTDEGRRIVPEIFRRCIAGESLLTIQAYLKTQTKRTWWPSTISGVIRNPVYRGVQEADDGTPLHKCEALVNAWIWRQANEALEKRPKRGPKSENPALLSRVLFCGNPDCPTPRSPMYRKKYTEEGRAVRVRYACAGRGAHRVTCGNMIPLVTLDGIVSMMMRNSRIEILETRVIPGSDHAAEIEENRFAVKALDIDDDDYDEKLHELRTERKRLLALPVVPDRVEEVKTGENYGDVWKRLSPPERGAWLQDKGMKIYARKGRVEIYDRTGACVMDYTTPETR